MKKSGKYDDLLHMQRHISTRHPPMPLIDRAAQFSPFAALTGYEDAIEETGRLTDVCTELTESKQEALDRKLRLLQNTILSAPLVRIRYFQPDARKTGGTYLNISGYVKKIDTVEQILYLTDGTAIGFSRIYELECEIFQGDHTL